MGFRAAKENAEKKKKNVKKIAFCVGCVLLAVACILSAFFAADGWKYYFAYPSVEKRNAGELRIHYLDVGQGDSTLIELPDGKVALIDGGRASSDTHKSILRYLNALDIDVIDYLVITHDDADHCGGLKEVLKRKKILAAYLPHTDAVANTDYAKVYESIVEEKCDVVKASRSVKLGESEGETPYAFSFLYPYGVPSLSEEVAEGNEGSAVIWLDYQGVGALFCGDAPKSVEEDLVRDHRLGLLPNVALNDTEILKVSHHGSETATSLAFLQYLGVETAVISCGKDNAYNHPSTSVLNRLSACDANVYRTDEQGHIMITISADGSYVARTIER